MYPGLSDTAAPEAMVMKSLDPKHFPPGHTNSSTSVLLGLNTMHYQAHSKASALLPSKAKSPSSTLCCKLCGAVFTSRTGLIGHTNRVHLKKHPHTCPVCGKGFTVRELFHDHLNMHNNIKAHTCQFCCNSYTYKSSLRQHLREGHCNKLKALQSFPAALGNQEDGGGDWRILGLQDSLANFPGKEFYWNGFFGAWKGLAEDSRV